MNLIFVPKAFRLTILNLRFAILEPLHYERIWARLSRAQSFGFIERAREKQSRKLRQLFLPNRNLT